MAARIIRPGTNKYSLYHGCCFRLVFLTSAKNQFPIIIAAIKTPAYLTSVNQLKPSIIHCYPWVNQVSVP